MIKSTTVLARKHGFYLKDFLIHFFLYFFVWYFLHFEISATTAQTKELQKEPTN